MYFYIIWTILGHLWRNSKIQSVFFKLFKNLDYREITSSWPNIFFFFGFLVIPSLWSEWTFLFFNYTLQKPFKIMNIIRVCQGTIIIYSFRCQTGGPLPTLRIQSCGPLREKEHYSKLWIIPFNDQHTWKMAFFTLYTLSLTSLG